MKRYLALLLVSVLMLTMLLTGCGKEEKPKTEPTAPSVPAETYGERTEAVLSTAIRTMSDSAFTDYALLKAIYANAFTNRFSADAFLTKELSELLTALTSVEADEQLIRATAAFGGTALSGKTVGEVKASSTLEQAQLLVGDLLLVGKGDAYAY